MGMPLKSLMLGNKYSDLTSSYIVDNSVFYSLCMQANSICMINYDTITLIDLLGFASLHCKDMYVDMSIRKRQEGEIKAKNMMNQMSKSRHR